MALVDGEDDGSAFPFWWHWGEVHKVFRIIGLECDGLNRDQNLSVVIRIVGLPQEGEVGFEFEEGHSVEVVEGAVQ